MAWNVLGILDLVVAITTGFITSPSTLFSYEPPNELIAIFPLVLIPVYLMPLSLLTSRVVGQAARLVSEQEPNRDGLGIKVLDDYIGSWSPDPSRNAG
jgi:hypothetical protein